MMKVVIIDTGCANLASVNQALRRLGHQPVISQRQQDIETADKLLLPGVGTAAAAMTQLQQRQLSGLIRHCRQPLLGICLGMQLLAQHSEENGGIHTLHVMEGNSKRLTGDLPLPHMGWNQLQNIAADPLFKDIAAGSYFYFVHSYALPVCAHTIAQTCYGQPFSAAVRHNNFFGVQFHPERSGSAGARLLQNFLEL